MLSCSVHQHDKHALLTEHREQVPFAGSSIHGPFMMFKMLQAPLYSRSGSSFGVRRKHLRCKRDSLLPDVSKSADPHAVWGVVCHKLRSVNLAGSSNKLLEHLPLIYGVHSCTFRKEWVRPPQCLQGKSNTIEGEQFQLPCLDLSHQPHERGSW